MQQEGGLYEFCCELLAFVFGSLSVFVCSCICTVVSRVYSAIQWRMLGHNCRLLKVTFCIQKSFVGTRRLAEIAEVSYSLQYINRTFSFFFLFFSFSLLLSPVISVISCDVNCAIWDRQAFDWIIRFILLRERAPRNWELQPLMGPFSILRLIVAVWSPKHKILMYLKTDAGSIVSIGLLLGWCEGHIL